MSIEEVLQRRRLERCGLSELPEPSGREYRAAGGCVCEICGNKYYDHPDETRVLGYDGNPVDVILCNGDRVKL